MSETALFWLLTNLGFVSLSAFYSMLEMAIVSFNKVRLHFYCIKGMKRASWVRSLLKNPPSLFGTTLIGVNVCMFTASECARQFHEAIGIDPNLAPISQVFIVVIFGELAPMFAARHYSEHVTLLGIPLIWASSKILTPFIWILSVITMGITKLLGKRASQGALFFSEDEIQKALESPEEEALHTLGEAHEVDPVAQVAVNIFEFEEKLVADVMLKRNHLHILSWNLTAQEAYKYFQTEDALFLPVYHKDPNHITALFKPRDLLKLPAKKRLRDIAKAPLYTSVNTKLSELLKQFKKSQQNLAICLDDRGYSAGVITQEIVLQEVIGVGELEKEAHPPKFTRGLFLKDKTFSGSIHMKQFNAILMTKLSQDEEQTLSEYLISVLGHSPEKGDKIQVQNFEFTVYETSLLEIKKIKVSSI